MRNVLVKIICVIGSLMIAFGVAEVAVRIFSPQEVAPIRFVFDPQLGEIPTPNQKGRKIMPGAFDHTYSHNSLGLRGSKEYSHEKQTDLRILFLGDSFTYGFGVNDDQAMVYQTEKHLLAKHFSVEAINAGNSGRGTDYELKFFQVLGHKFKPDLTILCFLANDFVDNERGQYYWVSTNGELNPKPLTGGRGTIKQLLYNLPGYNWLVSWSQAANLIKSAGVKLFLKTTDPKAIREGSLIIQYPEVHQGYATATSKRLTEIYLKHFIKSVQGSGSSLMICYLPIASEIEDYRKNHRISTDEAAITDIVKNQGEAILSLTPVLSASPYPVEKLYFVPKDGHWTALGNALAAQYLSEQIERRLKTGHQASQR